MPLDVTRGRGATPEATGLCEGREHPSPELEACPPRARASVGAWLAVLLF